jgi:hypothetical protein
VADQDNLFNITVVNPAQSSSSGAIRAGSRTRATGRVIAPPPRPVQQLYSPSMQTSQHRPAGQVAPQPQQQPQQQPQTLPTMVITPWEPTTPHRYQQVLDAAAAMQRPGVTPPLELSDAIDFINGHCALDQRPPVGTGRLICRPGAAGGQPAFLEDWLRTNYSGVVTPTEPAQPHAYGPNDINCYSTGVFASDADRRMWLAMHPGCPEPPVESVRAQATVTIVPSKIPIVPIAMVVGGVAAGGLAIWLIAKAMKSKPESRGRRNDPEPDEDEDEDEDE